MSAATRSRRRSGRRTAARHHRLPCPDRADGRLAARWRRLSPRRPWRLLSAVALGALVVAGTYLAAVRELAVFRVEAVDVEGASSGYGRRLSEELAVAARDMTTLHVREAELRRVAGRYPAVVSLETDAELPNRLAIRIVERPPVGLVESPWGRPVPVAGDGTLLRGQPIDRPLPRFDGRPESGRARVSSATVAAARLAATAPGSLGAWLERVGRQRGGWVVELREGPELRFGSLSDLDRKWSAAVAVLGARSALGARFIDVRLPDRPTAGGFAAQSARMPGAWGQPASEPRGTLKP